MDVPPRIAWLQACAALLVLLVLFTVDAQVTLTPSYQTDIRDVLYVGEELTLTCAVSGATAPLLLGILFDEISTADDDNNKKGPRCSGLSEGGVMPDTVKLLEGIEDTNCEALPDQPLSIKIQVNNSLLMFKTQCGYGTSFSFDQFEDFTLPIVDGKIFANPKDLTLDVSSTDIVENEEFSVDGLCQSSGADPPSQYRYEILRGDTKITDVTDGKYTPGKDDRTGFRVHCRDTVHEKWKTASDIEATSETLMPKYSDFGPDGADTVQERTFRPGTDFENYKLTCDIIGKPSPMFTWTSTKAGMDINSRTGRVLELNNQERVDGEKEDITCTGTVDYGAHTVEKTMTWAITWSDMATIPTTVAPTLPVTKAQVNPAVIGGSIGAVVMVITIVIVVACVCWKKKKGIGSQKARRKNFHAVELQNSEPQGFRQGGVTVASIAEYDEVDTLPHGSSQTPDCENANITSATNTQPYENIPDTRDKPDDDYEKLNRAQQHNDEHNYSQLNDLRI